MGRTVKTGYNMIEATSQGARTKLPEASVLRARFYKRGSQVGDKEYSYKFPSHELVREGDLVVVPIKAVCNEDGTYTFDTLSCAVVTAVGGAELLDPEVEKHSWIISVVGETSAKSLILDWQACMREDSGES